MKNTILIADDNPRLVHVLGRLLAGPGTRITLAADGPGVLAAARQKVPDLIILDVKMPGLSGLEVCAALREDPVLRAVPVLMLTGLADPSSELKGLEAGADRYVTKPFEPEYLKAQVESLLKRSRQALGANPLTRLPGNREIRAEAEGRLSAGRPFWFYDAEVRGLREFEEAHGLGRAETLLQAAARIFAREAQGDPEGFVGQAGEDEFVLLTERYHDAEAIKAAFAEAAGESGGDAAGVGLRLGVIYCEPGIYTNFEEVASAAGYRRERSGNVA